ncbi:hypothetical protein [Leifsonia xyli]|uniref:hypothetical protein n=1 Tax=Leifsonia xyli TaxID=1575 RepID=UPI003D66C1B4
MSSAEPKSSLYYLVEDFFVALLLGAAMAAVLVMIDASPRAILATALGAPGAYFLGQRYRRLRARKQVVPR